MSKLVLYILILFQIPLVAQLEFEPIINLGEIDKASEIKGDIILKNIGLKKIYLLRADAETGTKVFTSKKTLLPNDTCLLSISFFPDKAGKFNRKISLVNSFQLQSYEIEIVGFLSLIVQDGKTECYYFGKSNAKTLNSNVKEVTVSKESSDNNSSFSANDEVITTPQSIATSEVLSSKKEIETESNITFSETNYSPNNIIFLVDISGSMRDSLKLPLMKNALQELIDNIREVDKLTFITYADTIKIITEAANAKEKEFLHITVEALKAKGMTKGRKAILLSQQIAQSNFIEGGNNQIIIATDGKFRFEKDDQLKWEENQGDKKIIISTLAFGNDKPALRQLKKISKKGNGSFIHISDWKESELKLLEEIKYRSKK